MVPKLPASGFNIFLTSLKEEWKILQRDVVVAVNTRAQIPRKFTEKHKPHFIQKDLFLKKAISKMHPGRQFSCDEGPHLTKEKSSKKTTNITTTSLQLAKAKTKLDFLQRGIFFFRPMFWALIRFRGSLAAKQL